MDSEFPLKVKAKLVYVKDFHVAVVLVITGYIICKCFLFPKCTSLLSKVCSIITHIQSLGYENASLGEHFTKLVSSTEIVCNDSLLQVFI